MCCLARWSRDGIQRSSTVCGPLRVGLGVDPQQGVAARRSTACWPGRWPCSTLAGEAHVLGRRHGQLSRSARRRRRASRSPSLGVARIDPARPQRLLIRRSSGAWMIECTFTSLNGTSSTNSRPSIIIRPPTGTGCPGPWRARPWDRRRAGRGVRPAEGAKGHGAVENHVSRTSGSRCQPSSRGAPQPT